jgi:putative colanic acid biosynthesis UDP-glucose lipid carrier transferase
MATHRTKGIYQLTLLAQCAVITVAFWVWFLCFTPRAALTGETFGRYLIYHEFVLLGLLVGASSVRVHTDLTRPSFDVAGEVALRQTAAALFYLLLYLVALRDKAVSRVFLFGFLPAVYVLLVATFCSLPEYLGHRLFAGKRLEQVLLVGSSEGLLQARRWCQANAALGFRAVGVLCDDCVPGLLDTVPVLGSVGDLETVLSKGAITQVLLSGFPSEKRVLQEYSRICDRHGVRLLVVNDVNAYFGCPIAVFEDHGLLLIGLREEPLENPLNRFWKRLLDLVVALPMVLVVVPVCAGAVWLCQRLQSGGPLLHRQLRAGLQNRTFEILKFRTMHVHHESEARQATSGDVRVFPAGRWLRKLSLDELPQFVNVLRGEMSVVGPRPHLIEHNQLFARVMARYQVRALVKPGITGLAQVRGLRGEIKTERDITDRVEADIRYLENWSVWLDCWLILRTALQVVFPSRAAV